MFLNGGNYCVIFLAEMILVCSLMVILNTIEATKNTVSNFMVVRFLGLKNEWTIGVLEATSQ